MLNVRGLLLAGAALSLGLSASPASGQSEYYPLKEGSVWTYKVNGNTTTITVSKFEKVGELNCAVLETRNADGMVLASEHVAVTAKGVLRVKFANMNAEPPLMFLQLPVKTPSTWEFDTKIAAENVKGKFNASAVDEVKVPAGKFEKVVKVASEGFKANNQPISIIYYFAPKVGIIKQEIDINGVKINIELDKYEEKK